MDGTWISSRRRTSSPPRWVRNRAFELLTAASAVAEVAEKCTYEDAEDPFVYAITRAVLAHLAAAGADTPVEDPAHLAAAGADALSQGPRILTCWSRRTYSSC